MNHPQESGSQRHWMWAAATAIAVLYVVSTIPTALYGIYRREFGFAEIAVTQIYAIYVIGNLAVLLFFGRLSDQVGRKHVALLGLGLLTIATLTFLCATNLAMLFVARVLSGLSAGLGASALTAWIAELEPHHDRARGGAVASSANLAGLTFGGLLAGVLATWFAWPLRLSYTVNLVLAIALLVLLSRAPETVAQRVRSWRELSLQPRIGVPAGIRLAFLAPAAMAFSAFALGGFYAAIAPGILSDTLHESRPVFAGVVVAAFFATAALGAAVLQNLRGRRVILLALALLLAGLALLVLAEHARSLSLLGLATLTTGASMGFSYRGSLQIVNQIAPPDRRAELVASYLLVCYTANALPVIGTGLLARATTPAFAHDVFAAALILLACSACAIGLRHAPR
jgi:MFS family permease